MRQKTTTTSGSQAKQASLENIIYRTLFTVTYGSPATSTPMKIPFL